MAAEAVVRAFPTWTTPLLLLRNLVVLPLGLKGADRSPGRDMVGIFPVVSETSSRFVGGFNDRHLDFRLIVEVSPDGPERQRIKVTTERADHGGWRFRRPDDGGCGRGSGGAAARSGATCALLPD